ncbi:MAG TPA: DUF2892 domain-containing protein [Polyangiaceae bacterium]
MCIERYVRLVAGSLVLISVGLTYFVSPWFWLLTAFVGANLLQSAFTNWCPLISVLRALHVPACDQAEQESRKLVASH